MLVTDAAPTDCLPANRGEQESTIAQHAAMPVQVTTTPSAARGCSAAHADGPPRAALIQRVTTPLGLRAMQHLSFYLAPAVSAAIVPRDVCGRAAGSN